MAALALSPCMVSMASPTTTSALSSGRPVSAASPLTDAAAVPDDGGDPGRRLRVAIDAV